MLDLSIILPTMEGKSKYLELFFNSLEKNSNCSYEVLVWCNGCDKETIEVVNNNTDMVFGSDENIGLSIPYNFLVKESNSNLLFFADDDFYFLPKWDNPVSNYTGDNFFWRNPMLIEKDRPSRSIKDYFGEISNFRESELLYKYQNYTHKTIHYGGFMPAFICKLDYIDIGEYNEDFFIGEADFLYRTYKYYTDNRVIPTTDPESLIYHFRLSNRPLNFSNMQLKMFEYMENTYNKSIDEIDDEVPWFEVLNNAK
jgi:hypothetical protein